MSFAAPLWQKTFICKEYRIILSENPLGKYNYQSISKKGNISLTNGTVKSTEGVWLFKFRNANTEYWVWDGTLDNPNAGVLEVYQNNRQILQHNCSKN